MRERAKTMWLAGMRAYNSGEHQDGDANESRQQNALSDIESGYNSAADSPSPPPGTAFARRTPPRRKTRGLHIPLPTPAPFTLAQTRTPGWDTPWSGGTGAGSTRVSRSNTNVFNVGQGSNLGVRDYAQLNGHGPEPSSAADDGRKRSKWYYRRKRVRAFMLSNNYVPLVST